MKPNEIRGNIPRPQKEKMKKWKRPIYWSALQQLTVWLNKDLIDKIKIYWNACWFNSIAETIRFILNDWFLTK